MITAASFLLLTTVNAAESEIQYEGVFKVQTNGDIAVTTKMIMPMAQYQVMREGVSNLYLLMRSVASHRANIEVTDKKAEWDDANRTITFTMTWLGAAQNTGRGWQIYIPKGTIFSNIDEDKKTLYFFASSQGTLGKVSGQEHLILPSESRNVRWDNSDRIASYTIPSGKMLSGTSGGTLWLLAGLFFMVGFLLIAASFFLKSGLRPEKTTV